MNEVLIKLAEISTVQEHQMELLKKHTEILERQNETLIRNTITVEEHHKRSLFLEEEQRAIKEDLDPIKDHVAQIRGIGNFIKWLGVIGSVVGAIFGALKYFLMK